MFYNRSCDGHNTKKIITSHLYNNLLKEELKKQCACGFKQDLRENNKWKISKATKLHLRATYWFLLTFPNLKRPEVIVLKQVWPYLTVLNIFQVFIGNIFLAIQDKRTKRSSVSDIQDVEEEFHIIFHLVLRWCFQKDVKFTVRKSEDWLFEVQVTESESLPLSRSSIGNKKVLVLTRIGPVVV